MSLDEQEKLRRKELENNPLNNFSDSLNRSIVGDPSGLVKGGCLTKIFTLFIIILGLILLSQCSY